MTPRTLSMKDKLKSVWILFKRDTQQKESRFYSIKRPFMKFLDVESGCLFEVGRLIE